MKRILLVALLTAVFIISCDSHDAQSKKPKEHKMTDSEIRDHYMLAAKQTGKYKAAWMDVQEIRINASLVDSGLLKSSDVIGQYNDNDMGKTIGHVSNMSQLKKALKKDTVYLKFLQMKIASKLILEKASELNSIQE